MPRSRISHNEEYQRSADLAYFKGGFRPRRHGEHRDKFMLPDFPSQKGEVNQEWETIPNNIASVECLGTFLGYGHHGNEVIYRAHKVTLDTGLLVPAYSYDRDDFVMCQHTGYKAYRPE
jgi:hypothetical protein